MDEIDRMIAEEKLEIENNILNDPEKTIRIKEPKCKECYYSQYFGFSAMTKSRCKNCNKMMMFGNSDVNFYCEECAFLLNKCKHCGKNMD